MSEELNPDQSQRLAAVPPVIECQLLRSAGSFELSCLACHDDPLLAFANAAREAGLPLHPNYHNSIAPVRAQMLLMALWEVGARPMLHCEERMSTMSRYYQWYAAKDSTDG